MDKYEVVIADKYNHCLRNLNRHTGVITTFAGKCGKRGFKDGVDSLFYHPNGVYSFLGQYINETMQKRMLSDLSKDADAKKKLNTLYVTDQGNMAIRGIQADGQVVTLAKNDRLQGLSYLVLLEEQFIALTDYGTFSSGDSNVGFQLELTKPKKMLWFLEPAETMKDHKMAVIDDTNQLKVFAQLGPKMLLKACSSKKGSVDGDQKTCQLDNPQSLLAYEFSLLIGQYRSIRIIPGQ